MSINVEIFSQGEELLIGQIVDTNAAWLSEQLVENGFKVCRHTTVGDDLNRLVDLLREIAQRADCCICTGGLGPTCDDLTAEAVAEAFNLPLEFDAEAYATIQAFFERRQRPMPDTNRKQALLPRGVVRIDNHWGTAPGFAVQIGRCWFAFLPGVPYEMKAMFQATVLPYLANQYPVEKPQRVTLKTIGIGESAMQERIKDIVLPDTVQIGFKTSEEENQLKLIFPEQFPRAMQQPLITQMAQALGEHLFAVEQDGSHKRSLVSCLGELLDAQQASLALIESISHGLMAAKCVGQNWLLQASFYHKPPAWLDSLVYQFEFKKDDKLQTLVQMLRMQSAATYTLAQFCREAPELWTDSEQALHIDTFLAGPDSLQVESHILGGSLQRKQQQAALLGLDFLRRVLQPKLD